jgi:hypothetical protein
MLSPASQVQGNNQQTFRTFKTKPYIIDYEHPG